MNEDENSDDNGKPPGRNSGRSTTNREVALEITEQKRVLAPLMKSLGWELVGLGAEFDMEAELRKSTGRMRGLFGRQVSADERIVGSSPTASAIRA